MGRSKGQILEAIIAAACVTGGIYLLSSLDAHPMPNTGAVLSFKYLDDVKFYAPPLGAIAILVFSAPTLPKLFNIVIGTVGSTLVAFVLVHVLGASMFTRALACGLAMLFMKLFGTVYPPAGALAVLFVDNAAMHKLGIFYCLMPGLSGTLVLCILAAIKIEILTRMKPCLKKHDPRGEWTQALMP
mmetsp:Transcript_110505/g.276695  ORF Transcript_110505/g.276695 Transcript_110505/m.276695 type:complete len:186 (-) Transcript_110505:158-715(-)